jgi:hypothetical protein
MKKIKEKIIVASDVRERDGIGIEIYKNDKLFAEIFRDDTQRNRMIRIFDEKISFESMEKYIELFKKENPWDFIDYDKTD